METILNPLSFIAVGFAARLVIMTIGCMFVKNVKHLPKLPSIIGPIVIVYYYIYPIGGEYSSDTFFLIGLFLAENLRFTLYVKKKLNKIANESDKQLKREAEKKPKKKVHRIPAHKVTWTEKRN